MRRLAALLRRIAISLVLVTPACTTEMLHDDDAASGDSAQVSFADALSEPDGAVPADADADAGSRFPSPIRYVLVIIKENHTFDNFFTGFPGAETTTQAKLSDGSTITRSKAPSGGLSKDICHSNSCGKTAYRHGTMAGFDRIGSKKLPFVYYAEKQIPNYWKYAREFVLADHYFSTALGPSTPGHIAFWTSWSPVITNQHCKVKGGACSGRGCLAGADVRITAADPDTCATHEKKPCFDVPSIVDKLPEGFTWADYGGKIALMVKSIATASDRTKHFRKQGDMVKDLAAGKIKNLMIGHLWSGKASEHPPHDPCPGENLTVSIINAAMKTPQWKQMAIVVTWDDWGGFYDHVKPPVHKCKNGKIFRSGFRLPAIIISPYAKKGLVLSNETEQASVPKLIEQLWGMPFMSKRDKRARDGVAGSLMGAFDFQQTPRAPLLLKKRTCP